jgi:hypothetical protein
MSPIRAEVAACPSHRSYQSSFFRVFIGGECIVLDRELPLDRSANQVGLPCSTTMSGSLQPLTQRSGESNGNTIVFHSV